MAPLRLGRSGVGLDIGTSAVRAAEIRGGRPATVVRFGQVLLPQGAVRDGEVEDPGAVAQAIATLWKRAGFSSRLVRLGVSNQRVVVRQIEFPAMPREELEGAIQFQAQDLIPIPLAEAVMDLEVMEEVSGSEDQPMQRVMVVAAQRTMVDRLLAAVQEAKLQPDALELNAYPLVRALGGGESPLPGDAEAIVDIGAGVTNVVVHQGGRIRFFRPITEGGDDFTQALASAMSLEWTEAEGLKHRTTDALARRMGVPRRVLPAETARPAPTQEPEASEATEEIEPFAGIEDFEEQPAVTEAGEEEVEDEEQEDDEEVERAADLLVPQLQRFADNIRGSLDYYNIQPDALPLGQLTVTGGGSLLGGLIERLGTLLRIETQPGRAFSRVRIGKVKLDPAQIAAAEPFLSVAIGLALGALEE